MLLKSLKKYKKHMKYYQMKIKEKCMINMVMQHLIKMVTLVDMEDLMEDSHLHHLALMT